MLNSQRDPAAGIEGNLGAVILCSDTNRRQRTRDHCREPLLAHYDSDGMTDCSVELRLIG